MAMRKRDDEAVFPDAAGMTLGHQSHSVAAHQPQDGLRGVLSVAAAARPFERSTRRRRVRMVDEAPAAK